jgi:nucleoside-diphosphate-sugar epimerase
MAVGRLRRQSFHPSIRMAKLIFGCGYLGLRVARLWRVSGETVYAVTRSAHRARELAAAGIEPIVGDLLGETQLPLPQGVRTGLFSLGFDRSSGQSIQSVYVSGLARAIDWMPDSIDRFLYVSSTGVYGQVAGHEVDEDSACQPTREGGKACLAAEQLLLASRFSSKAMILRLAGLYGPERIPRSKDIIAGRPIDAPDRGWLNLIHVDDAAQIVLLAEERAVPPCTYVVSDGVPVQRAEYYAELARLLKAPPPRFADPSQHAPATERAGSDKRINPRRMFEEFRTTLLYPNYRVGLAAIVAASGTA